MRQSKRDRNVLTADSLYNGSQRRSNMLQP